MKYGKSMQNNLDMYYKDKIYKYSLKTNDWKVNLKDCGEGKVLKGLKIQS